MAGKPLSYELSAKADADLGAIFDYTLELFGPQQAKDYLTGFSILFLRLVENPELGRIRPEIRAELRSIMQGSHVVFYRVLASGGLRIVRILHGSRDVNAYLK